MRTVAAGEFKMHCLALLDQVEETHEMIVVTKRGKPVARVVPCPASKDMANVNPLKDSILYEDDIVSPLGEEWEAAK